MISERGKQMYLASMVIAGGSIIAVAALEEKDGVWINPIIVTIVLHVGVAGALWWLIQKIGSTFYLF